MNNGSTKRLRIGLAGSIAVHLFLILLLAFSGLFSLSKVDDKIVEVAIFSGGGGGGGGGGGAKPSDPTAADFAKARSEALASGQTSGQNQKGIAQGNEGNNGVGQITAGDIIDQITKDYEKNYGQNSQASGSQELNTDTDANQTQSRNIAGVEVTENTGTGGGYGTGQGTGYGSGYGPGSGSGSGGGHGAGVGTGIGDGTGPGIGTGSGGGYATGSGVVTESPAIPPRLVAHRQPVYPGSARSAGVEGTTTVRMLIGADGEVEEAVVSVSSGSDALDDAAVSACYKWEFTPAKNGIGQSIRCYTYVPISFRLR